MIATLVRDLSRKFYLLGSSKRRKSNIYRGRSIAKYVSENYCNKYVLY